MQSAKPIILCTGPVEESLLLSQEYKDADIDVIPFTTISTELPDATQRQIKDILSKKMVVIFTSGNAVKSVGDYMKTPPKEWTIFCIGNTTYSLAKKYFGEENIKETASTASKLAEKIIPVIKEKEVIFFCGNLRRTELPDALRKKGIEVKEIIVYKTSLVPVSINKRYDAVLFFSPSAAESFFSKNSVPRNTALFVMGETTAVSIKKYSTNQIITGDEPDKNKLISQAIKFVRDDS
ncbi:MAG TPA: uroporphyrinogen-III synthase [Chitinophagaceae bacterium]|nr:uroporphyrinogen-III synthase [Chitinophagaceae bacterium]